MPDVSPHPTPQALTLFGHGRLPEVQAAAVAAHLETCPACRNIVAELPADSFLSRVRAARPNADALAPAPPPADVPPELARHPKFRVIRELGRGGMGVIYLAEHRVMEKPVALKVISPAVLDNAGAWPASRPRSRPPAFWTTPTSPVPTTPTGPANCTSSSWSLSRDKA